MDEQGGINLYNNSQNDLVNFTDYLGLRTEADDVSTLRHEATSWRSQGWSFAANLLTAFFMKSGGYSPSQYDIDLFKNSSEYRVAAQNELQNIFKDTCGIGPGGGKVSFSKGSAHGPYAFDVQYTSGELFYALGGAHFYYSGYMIYCCTSSTWKAHITMTQEDFYTFRPTSYGVRLVFPTYRAAHELELTYGYMPFWHAETWKDVFESK